MRESPMEHLRIVYFSLLFVITAMLIAGIANAQSSEGTIIVPNQKLEVVIDVDDLGIAGDKLCGGIGSSSAAAVA